MIIALQVATFPVPTMPYIPAYDAWNMHVRQCAACREVDDRGQRGEPVSPDELCPDGRDSQLDLINLIAEQAETSLSN